MDKRPLVAILLVCLSLTLLAPPVAGGADAADEVVALSTGDGGFDGPTLDRLRLAAPTGSLGRIDTDGVLEQSTRAAVFSAVERTPGESLEAIAAAVGVTKSTVRYHVEVLCDAGLAETAQRRGELRVRLRRRDPERAGDDGGLDEASVAQHLDVVPDRRLRDADGRGDGLQGLAGRALDGREDGGPRRLLQDPVGVDAAERPRRCRQPEAVQRRPVEADVARRQRHHLIGGVGPAGTRRRQQSEREADEQNRDQRPLVHTAPPRSARDRKSVV